ncbi:ubiquitin-conjugating enzyme E2 Z-like [Amblyomma americanum]
MSDFWDPIPFLDEKPTKQCALEIVSTIDDIEDYRPPGLFVEEDETVPSAVPSMFTSRTPYDHGRRECAVRAELLRERKGVLGLLGTWIGPSWTTRHCIGSLLLSITSLFKESPISSLYAFGVLPAVGTWLSDRICYNAALQHETIRVAVCTAVEDCLQGTSPLPPGLRDVVLKHSPQFYGEYEKVVMQQLHLIGSFMNDAFEGGVAVYQYATLLERLMVMTRNQAGAY